MGYKTLFEQMKTVCAGHSLSYKFFTYSTRYVKHKEHDIVPCSQMCMEKSLQALTLSHTIHDFICTYTSTLFADQVTSAYMYESMHYKIYHNMSSMNLLKTLFSSRAFLSKKFY